MNAETADNAGMPQLKQFHMVNTNMFYHPKYYKELKKNSTLSKRSMTKNNSSHVDQEDQAALGSLPALDPQSDQVISKSTCDGESERAPGPGHKQQAASDSQVVNQVKLSSQSQAASKPEPVQVQASSAKRQASQPE